MQEENQVWVKGRRHLDTLASIDRVSRDVRGRVSGKAGYVDLDFNLD